MDIERLEIVHNADDSRFETRIENRLSKLEYMLNGRTMVMMHVGVDPADRGQGVAGRLTHTALEYAKANSFRVIPMCSYVAAFIRRNPQYVDLMKPQAGE